MRIKAALFLLTVLGASSYVQAGGGLGNIVYDPTNFSKNTLTAAQTAQQVSEQIESKIVLIQQYNEMIRLGKTASADLLRAGSPLVGSDNLLNDLRTAAELKSRIDLLRSTLNNLDKRSREVSSMAHSNGLTTPQYIEHVITAVQRGDANAARHLDENARAMSDVNNAYHAVQAWEQNNPGQTSQLAAMQSLNQQMSGLVKINARLMEYQVQTNNVKIQNQREEEALAAIDEAKRREDLERRNSEARSLQDQIRNHLRNQR